MARMHKDKAALPPSTNTNTNTQHVAVEGLLTTTTATTISTQTSSSAFINNKAPTEGRETTPTSTRTSTISNPTNRVSAAAPMSTPTVNESKQSPQSLHSTQTQQLSSMPDSASSKVQSTTTRISVMGVVENPATLVASRPIERLGWKCICGKVLNGYRGYKSHIRGCAVSKRLLVSPVTAQANSPTVSQSASQDHEAVDVDNNYRSAGFHSLPSDFDFDLNSNKLN